MKKIPVLHIIDSLNIGGTERMAVSLVNGLIDSMYEPHLCVTRQLGPLGAELDSKVDIFYLDRKSRFDVHAVMKCFEYVRDNNIRLIHAHSSSIFLALLLSFFAPDLLVLWHVHRGEDIKFMPFYEKIFYQWAAQCSSGIACVSIQLMDWATVLKSKGQFIWYLPNFNARPEILSSIDNVDLPGKLGNRVICVSNLKAQKDLITLLKAWQRVIGKCPESNLILVGGVTEQEYSHSVLKLIKEPGLKGHVSWLGARIDIPYLLAKCQIGVLSSRSEGFPVTLLEYGMAKLGVVATNVGQCAEILDYGNAGLLVPPGDPIALSDALITLLSEPSTRQKLGVRLFERVSENFSQKAVLDRLFEIYQELIFNQSKVQ